MFDPQGNPRFLRAILARMVREPAADGATTLHKARFRPSRLPTAPFVLTVTGGSDMGKRLQVDGREPARLLLGSGPACEFRLTDRTVSRRHVALDTCGDALRIVDLDSRNGTRINGVLIADASLQGGEVLSLGDTVISVTRGAAGDVRQLPALTGFGSMVGASLEMRRLYPLCERLALAEIPVIIEGETGVGKELLAESLHAMGPRKAGPFVVFDCTAVPANLLESELFGHEKGAFTGAVSARRGVFQLADGGTLLIDEIGDLDLPLQSKLLRAIERSEFRPVGGERTHSVDVRILAATRRDLDREVAAGRFRDDLFHRLAVSRIELPPLRERKGDIAVLVEHLCESLGAAAGSIPAEVMAKWEDSAWPGNVRELRNAVARYLALGELGRLESISPTTTDATEPNWLEELLALELPLSEARDQLIHEFERRYIQHALSRSGGNVTHAARASGVGRRYFQTLKSRLQSEK
jgi:transcriptional regulator with GAF, ATPase, and Fis domain